MSLSAEVRRLNIKEMRFLPAYFLFIIMFLYGLCQAQKGFAFKIIGTTQSSGVQTIVFSYAHEIKRDILVSAVPLVQGKFEMQGRMQQHDKVILYIRGKDDLTSDSLILYPHKEAVSIDFTENTFHNCIINQEKTQIERNYLTKLLNPIYEEYDKIRKLHIQTQNRLNLTQDEKKAKKLKDSLDFLYRIENDLVDKTRQIENSFIKSHPFSFLSLELLVLKAKRALSDSSTDAVNRSFDELSLLVKKSPQGNELAEYFRNHKLTRTGSRIPFFSVVDSDGDTITNETYKQSKLILLDFWASWCVPCRKEFPFLKVLQESYKNKGFQIIGLSIDIDTSKFFRALDEENLLWPNGLFKEKDHRFLYIQAVPLKILIDEDGIILGKWWGDDEEIRKSIEIFLKRLL